MDNINARLNKIAEYYNLNSYSDFSKRTGIKHQTVSNYLKGKQKPDADKLAMIIIAFDEIDPNWLLTGRGHMLKKDNVKNIETLDDENSFSEEKLQIVIDGLLNHEEFLLNNPVIKQWYDNKMLLCENNLLKSLKDKKEE